MTDTPLPIAIVLPDDLGVAALEVAGRPAWTHSADRLHEEAGHTLRILSRDEQRGWPDSVAADDIEQDTVGILVVDARTVLSRAASRALLDAATGKSAFRVLAPAAGAPGHAEPSVLAAYIPGPAPGEPRLDLGWKPLRAAIAPIKGRHSREIPAQTLDPASVPCLMQSFEQLAILETQVLRERALRAMAGGIRMRSPETTHLRGTLHHGTGVEIDANVILEGEVTLGDGVVIGANCIIRNATIGSGTRVHPFSLVEGSRVGSDGFIGPYGRVRPGCEIGDRVQVGNYVEIKGSRIGDRCRINHHTFIGDSILEDEVTIGAGTITCNHDGHGTNPTFIGRGAYVGSGCRLIAPLQVGSMATIGAGSTITHDVPPGKLTLARARQQTVDDWQGPRRRGDAK